MPKRRVPKKDGVDPAALAVLQVGAIQNVLQRGGEIPKSWRAWKATPEFTGEWLGRSGILALALYERTIRAGMSSLATTVEKQLAVKVAENVLDRVAGKPTERIQHAGGVTIHWGGLNPDLFPKAPRNGEGDPPRVPKPVSLLPVPNPTVTNVVNNRADHRPGSYPLPGDPLVGDDGDGTR